MSIESDGNDIKAEFFCDFCDKERFQVALLPCTHGICANCYPDYYPRLNKCFVCMTKLTEVKRKSMKIFMRDIDSLTGLNVEGDEKFFCSSEDCNFIGNIDALIRHGFNCEVPTMSLGDEEQESTKAYLRRTRLPGKVEETPSRKPESIKESRTTDIPRAEGQDTEIPRAREERARIPETPKSSWTNFFLCMLPLIFSIFYDWYGMHNDLVNDLRHGAKGNLFVTQEIGALETLISDVHFSKARMIFAHPQKLGKYTVRLAVGATWSSKINDALIWVGASITKDDDRPWTLEDDFRLGFDHETESRMHSQIFSKDDIGEWETTERDIYGRHRNVLHATSNPRMKFLRYTNLQTFMDALSSGHIKNGKMKVFLNVLRTDDSQR